MLSELEDLQNPIPQWLSDAMAYPRTSGFVEVEDCPIHYLCWGDSHKRPLLFLHGRMSHSRCWAFVAPQLAENYYCIAIDSSGMGDSGHRDQYARSTRATEIKAVAKELQLLDKPEQPILVSHSFGAVTAIDALKSYPTAFYGLIACDPSFEHPDGWSSLEPRKDGIGLTRPHRSYSDLSTAMSRFRFAPAQISKQPVLEEYIARHSLKKVDNDWCWKFDPLVYSTSEEGHNDWWIHHTQDFVKLQTPKAIIYAEHSELINQQTVEAVRELCSDYVPIYAIADAAHHLMADQPVPLAQAIQQAVLELVTD